MLNLKDVRSIDSIRGAIKMNDKELLQWAQEAGFNAAIIPTKDIPVNGVFRKYCEENYCGKYNANYSCPPGCGSVE